MKKFKIISKEAVINEKYCKIEKQRVLTHNGKELDWFVRHSSDAVVVIPSFSTGEIMLQKTYKHGARSFIVEFPAGMIDEKESPLHAAARELREETGLVSNEIVKIGGVLADPTGSPMRYHFFFAGNCQAIADTELDESEQIETFLMKNFEEANDYLISIMDPKSSQKDKSTKVFQTSSATISALSFLRNFIDKK